MSESSEETDKDREKRKLKDKKRKNKRDNNDDERKKSDKIFLYLDGEEFKKKKYDVSQSLSDLRTKLGKDINETSLFLDKKGEFINLEDEENLCISQILKDNKLNLKTKPEKKNELEAAETPDDNNEECRKKRNDLNKDSKTKGNITSNTIKDNEKQKNGKSKTENSEEGSPNDDDKKIKKKN